MVSFVHYGDVQPNIFQVDRHGRMERREGSTIPLHNGEASIYRYEFPNFGNIERKHITNVDGAALGIEL